MFFSINLPFDSAGQADPRTGCWGTAGYCDVLVQFKEVPDGKHVRILSFLGDCYAFLRGVAPAGTNCGILCGFITATKGPFPDNPDVISGIKYIGGFNDASPLANATPSHLINPTDGAYSDCDLFLCDSVGPTRANTRISVQVNFPDDLGILDANNCLLMRQALFLNDTGCPVHMEFTGVIEFDYVDAA